VDHQDAADRMRSPGAESCALHAVRRRNTRAVSAHCELELCRSATEPHAPPTIAMLSGY